MTSAPALAYLFFDLETTGLDETTDVIVEVAAVGATLAFDPLFTVEEVATPDQDVFDKLTRWPGVWEMHENNGLLADLRSGHTRPLADVEATIVERLQTFPWSVRRPVLAGSGVSHFDYRFLKAQMPRLTRILDYSTHDVGVLCRAYQRSTGTSLSTVNEDKTHRAMREVECHLAEARAFHRLFTDHARGRAHERDAPRISREPLGIGSHSGAARIETS